MASKQDDFLAQAYAAAQDAGHIFPDYAACEAALESAWGKSRLARLGNNLFGMKQHVLPIYDTLTLPTKEYLGGAWVTVQAQWVKYPDWAACLADRMATLKRLPRYAKALAAPDGETFVREVSKIWATDPQRADKVLQIHRAHAKVFSK